MSKKHMGSWIDDFLKEEGIFEEGQAEAVKGGCRLAARRGYEETQNLQEQETFCISWSRFCLLYLQGRG
ncbi:MAG: hypothetical protein WBY93_05240 [Candidatus Binatus sp.]